MHPRANQFPFFFGFVVESTLLARQLQQERIHVVRSNREARKLPAESDGAPAMDLGFADVRKRKCTDKRGKEQNTHP